MNTLSLPTQLHFVQAYELIDTLTLVVKQKKCALFLSESAAERLNLLTWIETLNIQTELIWIKSIPTNPTYQDITATLKQLKTNDWDLFIAIGGGSTLDLAKSVAALGAMNETIYDDQQILRVIQEKSYLKNTLRPKLIGVPTTAGTGSELTRWATVWDKVNIAKYSIETPTLAFDEAYFVVSFTLSMPKKLTLSTGLDALCQATEAYWAKSTTPSVQRLALQAIRIIVNNLPKVLSNLDNLDYRTAMMHGSILAALAFSNTKTTACHSISYPLTLKFNLDHGIACALSLGDILRHNLSALTNPESVYEAFNIDNPEALRSWIELNAKGIVSFKLSDYGVTETDLESLAALSFTLGRMNNNPVDITHEQVKQILKRHL